MHNLEKYLRHLANCVCPESHILIAFQPEKYAYEINCSLDSTPDSLYSLKAHTVIRTGKLNPLIPCSLFQDWLIAASVSSSVYFCQQDFDLADSAAHNNVQVFLGTRPPGFVFDVRGKQDKKSNNESWVHEIRRFESQLQTKHIFESGSEVDVSVTVVVDDIHCMSYCAIENISSCGRKCDLIEIPWL